MMLTLRNVSVGYGSEDVVKGVSFGIAAGENLSIIGPNGCGKTTLLKAIANVLPYRGEIEISGVSTRKMKHREIARKIAMLNQVSGIYFSYTVYDTVMMGRYPHIHDRLLGLPSDDDRLLVERCLEAVDMWGDRERGITTLSGGQLQRVFLARTLAQEPEIILLDEPTNHLDLKYQIELIEYLKDWLTVCGCAVIGVMHDINLALRLAGKFLVMKEGRIQAFGDAGDILSEGLLEKTYEIDVAGYMRESLRIWESVRV